MPGPTLPGNPNARQIANADQRMAQMREVADRLLAAAPEPTGDRLADVIRLAQGPIVQETVDAVPFGMEPVFLFALCGELLYRLKAGSADG